MIRIGLLCLVLASLSHWFLHPSANFSAGLIDGAQGFLYGVSIAFLLLGLKKSRRQGSAKDAGPCA
jgi:hypothetical protein